MRKPTPFEQRLRRIRLLRAMGHDPTAPNCYWADPEDITSGKTVCKSCATLPRKVPALQV